MPVESPHALASMSGEGAELHVSARLFGFARASRNRAVAPCFNAERCVTLRRVCVEMRAWLLSCDLNETPLTRLGLRLN